MRQCPPRHRAEIEQKANLAAQLCTQKRTYETREASAEEVDAYMKESEARVALALQKGLYK